MGPRSMWAAYAAAGVVAGLLMSGSGKAAVTTEGLLKIRACAAQHGGADRSFRLRTDEGCPDDGREPSLAAASQGNCPSGNCDTGGTGNSFTPDTPVVTADGGHRPIGELRAGDLVATAPCPTGSCSPGSMNSFTPDTPVVMADGVDRPIGDVRTGDRVTGGDSAQPVLAVITGTGVKDLVEITADGATVTATARHLFWVSGHGWMPAEALRPGHRLGDGPVVTAVRRATRYATVHNLHVAGPHTYTIRIGDHDVPVHS
ncbi:Hint domain-containing protein [Streptosporangium sp. NPDC003464]